MLLPLHIASMANFHLDGGFRQRNSDSLWVARGVNQQIGIFDAAYPGKAVLTSIVLRVTICLISLTTLHGIIFLCACACIDWAMLKTSTPNWVDPWARNCQYTRRTCMNYNCYAAFISTSICTSVDIDLVEHGEDWNSTNGMWLNCIK
jgi:hypothetical protein